MDVSKNPKSTSEDKGKKEQRKAKISSLIWKKTPKMFKPLTMCLGVRPARLDSMHREPRRFRQWNLHHLNTKSDPLGLHLFYCLATPTPHNPVSGFGQVSEKNQSYKLPIENTVYLQVTYQYLVDSFIKWKFTLKLHQRFTLLVCKTVVCVGQAALAV